MREKFLTWRQEHISDRQFTLVLSFFVGLFAAVAAFSLHWFIRQIQLLLTEGFTASSFNWLYLVYPVIGIYLTSLFVRYIVKDNISHGITRILYAISTKKSRLKAHNTWSSVIASAITIGFGGSAKKGALPEYVILVRLETNTRLWGSNAVPVFNELSNYMLQYLRIEPVL